MKHTFHIRWPVLLLALLYSATSFAQWNPFDTETKTTVTSGQGSPDIQSAQAEAYNGPKARVAVSRFTNKSGGAWYSSEIGDGMADQLTTALFNSGRYIVLERATLSDVLTEQDLGASGRISRQTAAPIGQIEGAELLITGAVTEFQGDSGGTRGFGGGKLGNVLGALAGSVRKAHMAIDLRVIDARTSRILAATSVEGESTDVDIGGALGAYWGSGGLGGALSSWKNTPKEKALRAVIEKAVAFIVSKTPASYYRHGSGVRRASAGGSAPRPAVPQYAVGSGVRVKSASLNVRSGPGTSNPVVFKVRQGDPLIIGGQKGDWVQVTARGNQQGWTAGWLVETDTSVTPASLNPPPMAKPAPVKATAPAAPAAASGGSSLEQRLRRLKSLHDKGLISDGEYAAKRDEILQSL